MNNVNPTLVQTIPRTLIEMFKKKIPVHDTGTKFITSYTCIPSIDLE